MSTLITTKGQAEEAGNLITDWPADGIVNMLIPFDDDALDLTCTEVLTSQKETVNTPLNNADGTSTFAFIAAMTLAGLKDIGNSSAVFFFLKDLHATGATEMIIGNAGVDNYFTVSSVNGGDFTFKDSDGVHIDGDGEITAAGTDQLIMVVLDRPNGTVKLYGGNDGTTLYGTIDDLTSSGTFDFLGYLSFSTNAKNTNGMGILRFDKGLPGNWLAMVQDIATNLRVGATGSFPDSQRVKWIGNIVDEHIL